MFRAVSRFVRRTARSFGPGRIYRSPLDSTKALILRISSEKPRWPLIPRRNSPWGLRLRYHDSPVYVRPSASDFFVLRDLFEDQEYGPVAQFNLRPDATIVDLGGNIGLSVRYFLSLSPEARITVVEPDPGNLDLLRLNCKEAIAAGQVTAVQGFAAATDGQAPIDRTDQPWGFKKRDDAATPPGAELIPCVSIPTLLRTANIEQIDLLKVDIEGAEKELFADCRNWIGRVRNIAIETHSPYTVDDFYKALRAADWPFEIVHEIRYTPAPRIFVRRK